ncbi:MAG TPA: hypothetical protein PL041_10110 [Melioribacteraceae bacterium]|nr:hypothetical protein [Melioribacteraceae bacterium]
MSENFNINTFVNGMVIYNYCFGFENLLNLGFNLEEIITIKHKNNTETEVQTFLFNDITAKRIVTTIETLSEGTLTFQSFYIFEKDKLFYDGIKKF